MDAVTLCECFARDGLQHEPAFIPTPAKRQLVERFAALGFRRVEATSYSNPKVVPQFADATPLLKSLERKSGVHYKATCANLRAVERALADLDAGFGANEISLLVSATEAHSQKNLNRSRAEQWQNIEEMARAARHRGILRAGARPRALRARDAQRVESSPEDALDRAHALVTPATRVRPRVTKPQVRRRNLLSVTLLSEVDHVEATSADLRGN